MTAIESQGYDSIEDVNRNQWDNLVEHSEHGTVFHRYGWLKVIETGLCQEGHHIVASKDGNPVAVLPNFIDTIDVGQLNATAEQAVERIPLDRMVSIEPGFGGPLVVADTHECLDAMFGTLDTYYDRNILNHTIRAGDPGQLQYSKYLRKRGFSPTLLSCRFVVDTGRGMDRIERGMDRSRRRGVRNGREKEIQVTVEPIDETPIGELYRDYRRNMNRIDGSVFPRPFLTAIAEEFADRAVVFTATADEDVLGRYVHIRDDEQSTLRYFLSAVGDESGYEHNVSELLHWTAMEWSEKNGYSTYDFGATGADFRDGLFKYKDQYGGDIVPILQWQQGTSPLMWPLYKVGRKLYQKVRY